MNHLHVKGPIDCHSQNIVHTETHSSELNLTLRTTSSVIFHLCKLLIPSLISSLDRNAKGVEGLVLAEGAAIFLLIFEVNVGTNADNAISTKRSIILSETNNSHRTIKCSGPTVILTI